MHRPGATQEKLFIVVRGDLTPGLAAAQAVHAAFSFAMAHPDITREWSADPWLAVLTVPDETALIGLTSKALARGVRLAAWHEPDMGDSLTAVALEPSALARRCTANLPLFGRLPLAATG